MKFDSVEVRELYYDALIDIFKTQDYEGFERGVAQMNKNDIKFFLIYVFKGKDMLLDMNSIILFRLILDFI